MGLAVPILGLVGVPIPTTNFAVCVPPRCVPLPGQPSTGGNVSDISLVYASRLLASQELLLPEANSV